MGCEQHLQTYFIELLIKPDFDFYYVFAFFIFSPILLWKAPRLICFWLVKYCELFCSQTHSAFEAFHMCYAIPWATDCVFSCHIEREGRSFCLSSVKNHFPCCIFLMYQHKRALLWRWKMKWGREKRKRGGSVTLINVWSMLSFIALSVEGKRKAIGQYLYPWFKSLSDMF